MATLIKLKYSLNTAVPGSLANGEPAFTANGDVFYIGSNDAIIAIAGKRTPGTLSANQAIVVNSTSYIDQLKTVKLFLTDGTANVTTINTVANSTVLGAAVNTEITSTWAIKTYVDDKISGVSGAPGGANTEIQFNDSAVFAGSAGFTFNKTTNNITIGNTATIGTTVVNSTVMTVGNSTVNAIQSSIAFSLANSTVSSNLQTGQLNIGANSNVNTTAFFVGNSTVNAVQRQTSFALANSTVSSNLDTGQLRVGANVTVNTTTVLIGNSTVNTVVTSSSIVVANSTGTSTLNPTTLTVQTLGGSQINTSANLSFTGANVSIPNANLAVKDLTVSGNLVVTGTLTSVDATNMQVTDSLIKLAKGNAGNTLDIGFYGLYNNGSDRYTGLTYDASSGLYELFANTTAEPTTTINTGGVGYVTAVLKAYLNSGALVSNATNLNVTANSTLAVAIVANTLSLSSALTGPNGGTGYNTYTAEDILVANTTNGFRKLAFVANKVLQSNGTAILYDDIDGGTF